MVVKRNTHHKPVVPRVQPLLKCAPSCRVRTFWMDDEARGHHTERSLQLDDSHHDRNNIARHPSTAARVTQTSLVIIQPPASSCQLRRGRHSTTPLNPLFDGLGSHTSLVGGR
jgi:hypothetical protein